MYQRIFVPIDDSKISLYALEQTCRLAKATDAVLVAVHVVDLTDLKREASRLPNSEELYAAEMQVADHAEAVMKQAGVKYEVSTLENDGMRIADVLIKEAVRQECDLIAPWAPTASPACCICCWAPWPKACCAKPPCPCCCSAARTAKPSFSMFSGSLLPAQRGYLKNLALNMSNQPTQMENDLWQSPLTTKR